MSRLARVAVLGGGSWGTALALLAAHQGAQVRLWARDAALVDQLNTQHENVNYLPGVTLPPNVSATVHAAEALAGADLVIFAIPSRATRLVATQVAELGLAPGAVVLSCAKGIEKDTGLRMSQILAETILGHTIAVLSGPNHAEEIARGKAAAAVIGCSDEAVAAELQSFFTLPWFRTYTSTDTCGIEWGAAAKNIFAIAAGISEGLGLGDNSKAALLTRGLAEMIRLGVAEGGLPETFQGLSGVGDLIATCFSSHSRNNRFGKMLGEGLSLAECQAQMTMVAEGVPNTESIYFTSRRHGVRTPIIDQVYAILYHYKSPKQALTELLSRDPRREND